MTSKNNRSVAGGLGYLLGMAAGALFRKIVRRPQREAALAASWEAMRVSIRQNPSARLCFVTQVHQRATTGTKAFVRWSGKPGNRHDAWFRGSRLSVGTYALVEGFYRYGPHRHEPQLFDVTRVVRVVPESAYKAWQRRRQHLAEQRLASPGDTRPPTR
ncbi:hypothetical protein [Winogradskya consettensis]|uniref:hypothetical protein n=1 Tax=Winogradskya consettensis TaxID=113560 RepID=UPI001BB424F9|nr:hypothetical protein [Actinoplanes consettensis]